ncbi:MAG: hypothetical protein LQ350_005942 [Teloschistes chrysophthalmus]|nr:MAG: hypothetical protein LQ350_005942 [Niorma chrysophthalma]
MEIITLKLNIDPGKANTNALHYQALSGFNVLLLMASSEVDQKFLGRFAKQQDRINPYLASYLYKVLGLSTLLSKKLIRARRLRKLDTTRDTPSLRLYHEIIWLSREGLVMVEQYIIPMAPEHAELRVLAHKLRASFYHIFVLFHNQPSVNRTAIPSFPSPATINNAIDNKRSSIRTSPNPFEGGPVQPLPPGLAPVSVPRPSAAFLLPATDYVPTATTCFTEASALADALLSGSHPIRLSVKTEYAAYMYDCLHDGEGSRRLAQQAIKDVYMAQEGMDDDMFEDAAEMVQLLGKMMKRGMGGSAGSSTPRIGGNTPKTGGGSGPGEESSSTPKAGSSDSTPRGAGRERVNRSPGLPTSNGKGNGKGNGKSKVGSSPRASPSRSR